MNINNKSLIGGTIGSCISALGINVSDLQSIESIVAIVCTALGLAITIITSLVIPLIRWWKNAKKDGKIDADEAEDLANKVKDGLTEVKKEIEKDKKE